MPQFLAIVAYRCLVAGVSKKKLDVQVRWFDVESEAAVRRLIEDDPIHGYKNSDDENVCWELAEIFEIEPFAPQLSGEEVIGFIASSDELAELAE